MSQRKAWFFLIIAGILEVVWAYGLKLSEGFSKTVPSLITVVVLALSLLLFSKAMKKVPIGTAYAVFTGIGSVGVVLVGMFLLREPIDWLKLFFVFLLLGGVIGLKSTEQEEKGV